MNSNSTTVLVAVTVAAGICLAASQATQADGFATGSGQITNIQYGLSNPDEGTINWFYDDGFGNPAWWGEAWVQVSDSLGGADADYYLGDSGIVSAFASTTLAWGSVDIDLDAEELYGASEATIPVDGWAYVADHASMYNYFSITPGVLGSTDGVNVYFSLDYEIHLTGQAEPGAPYYVDKAVGMKLEYEDDLGNWQLVDGGQLFFSEFISGSGSDSDDVMFSGTLSTEVLLAFDLNYSVDFYVYDNVPEPATLTLMLAGGVIALRRRRTS
jgi:hypothetical protein